MTLNSYFGDWLKVIDEEELLKVVEIVNKLYRSNNCEPEYKNIFKVFNITPYKDTTTIILGMDPYPQKGISTGVAFANKKDVKSISPSLNIIKEAVINFDIPHNYITFDPTLEEWSRQGILLLNTSLTVEVGKPGSHSVIWYNFMKKLLLNLSEWNPGLIYVLMGSSAKLFSSYISKTNHIIKTNHPAYYARTSTKLPHDVFYNISKLNKLYFDKDIKWFNEVKFNDREQEN